MIAGRTDRIQENEGLLFRIVRVLLHLIQLGRMPLGVGGDQQNELIGIQRLEDGVLVEVIA
jgi:hypothetical protein